MLFFYPVENKVNPVDAASVMNVVLSSIVDFDHGTLHHGALHEFEKA